MGTPQTGSGTKKLMLVIHHKNDPGCTIILTSGWRGYFHIISENPEDGDLHHEHSFESEEWVRSNFKDPLLKDFLNSNRVPSVPKEK